MAEELHSISSDASIIPRKRAKADHVGTEVKLTADILFRDSNDPTLYHKFQYDGSTLNGNSISVTIQDIHKISEDHQHKITYATITIHYSEHESIFAAFEKVCSPYLAFEDHYAILAGEIEL